MKTRVQIHLDADSLPHVEKLKCQLQIANDVQFFRYVIAFLKYLVAQIEQEATIYIEAAGRRMAFDPRQPIPRPATALRHITARDGRRFQIDLTSSALLEFDQLVADLQMATRAALFRHSLRVLYFVATEVHSGGHLGMRLNGHDYRISLIGLTQKAEGLALQQRARSAHR